MHVLHTGKNPHTVVFANQNEPFLGGIVQKKRFPSFRLFGALSAFVSSWPVVAGFQSFGAPIAISFSVVRKKIVLSEIAGVDSDTPPSWFVASTVKLLVAARTNTAPSSPVK